MRRLAHPFLIVAVLWALVGLGYLSRTPDTVRSHDVTAHMAYARTLIETGQLPTFEQSYESWQPPLYYYVASAIAPRSSFHATAVRLVSWLLGLVSLGLLYFSLRRLRIAAVAAIAALVFLATTPKFVFYFTTYNNDALVGALAIAVITVFLMLRERWIAWQAALLWAAAAVALNAKLSVVILFAVLAVVLIYDWFERPERRGTTGRLALIGLSVPLSLLPWMVLHLLPTTGSVLPHLPPTLPGSEYHLIEPAWRALSLPAITNGEWIDPYAYGATLDGVRWKAQNFWSFLFVTSIYGEYSWSSPPHAVFWGLVWLHLLVLLVVVRRLLRSEDALVMGRLFVFSVIALISLPMVGPFSHNMDFRYISWAWFPFVALLGSALVERPDRRYPVTWGLGLVLGLATILHLLVLFSGESCCW